MIIKLPFDNGDALVRNPIMVASTAGSIYGSHLFVPPFHEQSFTGSWLELPFRGNEDIRLSHLEEDAKILSRSQAARQRTMPYVVHGRHASPPKARMNASQTTRRRSVKSVKKSGFKSEPKVKSSLTFGSIPAQHMNVAQLHELLIQYLEVEVLPTLRIEPSHASRKINRELSQKFRHATAKKIAQGMRHLFSKTDPTSLMEIFLTQAKKNKFVYKILPVIKQYLGDYFPNTQDYKKVLQSIRSGRNNKNNKNNKKNNYRNAHKNYKRDNDNNHPCKTHTHRHSSQACMATATKVKTKTPKVQTIPEDEEFGNTIASTSDQGSVNLISFSDAGEEQTPENNDFAVPPSDRNLVPPIHQDDAQSDQPTEPHNHHDSSYDSKPRSFSFTLPSTPTTAIERIQPELLERNHKIEKALIELEQLGVQFGEEIGKERDIGALARSYRTPGQNVSYDSYDTSANLNTTQETNKTRSYDPHEDDYSSDSSSSYNDSSNSSSSDDSSTSDISLPPAPDQASGVAATNYWISLNQSAKKLKRAKKKVNKRKKKSKASADVIFRYLMKSVTNYELPVLEYSDIPGRRRARFHEFLEKLKYVTSSVRQTKDVLADTANPKKPKKKAANQALFRVLCTRVDPYMRTQLDQLTASIDGENGYKAILLIQKLFADKNDPDYKQYAENAFKSIKLRETESIYLYNKRFGYLYRNFSGCGLTMPEVDKARLYLRGLLHHPDTGVIFEVKSHINSLRTSDFKGLTEIQRLLLHEEEQNQVSTRQQPRTRKD